MDTNTEDKEPLGTEQVPAEQQKRYFGRDMSWLSFNHRVLEEAKDKSIPLYERIKFLAIYSSNRDEFFRVRIAALRSLAKAGKKKLKTQLGFKPKSTLNKVLKKISDHQQEFFYIFKEEILPELRENNIILIQSLGEILDQHKPHIRNYFRSKVMAYLQPVIFSDNRETPFLENRAIYLGVALKRKNYEGPEQVAPTQYAIINVPSRKLPRFIELPFAEGKHYYIFLDDIIRQNLTDVFPGFEILDAYSIKMNRDAELYIDDEFSGDLVEKIRKRLDKRSVGAPSRFVFDSSMPDEFSNFLKEKFSLTDDDMVEGGSYHSLYNLFSLPNPLKPKLEGERYPPLPHPHLEKYNSIFEALDNSDCILHFPYHSYDYVLRFFNEAAIDPFVTSIKLTVYRIATASFIANALISAVKNGKDVTVFVELKARFDEENNLRWAKEMEAAGVKIIYSIPGLKVHAKVAYVSRNVNGDKKRYAFFGTGNFNESTAAIYSDYGMLTTNHTLIQELRQVFKFLTMKREKPEIKHLLVAQINLVERFIDLIDREIAHAKAGRKAYLLIKVNNLEDPVTVEKLYEASQAGVKIDLIVRSICCIVPNKSNVSENIRVIRIVDMFLEHARAFYFYNNGQDELYLGSADYMQRNLYRRVEVVFPVENPDIKAEVMHTLKLQLEDNTKARVLDQKHKNIRIPSDGQPPRRAQTDTYNWVKGGCQSCEPFKI